MWANGEYMNYCYVGLEEEVYCYSYDISDPTNPRLIGEMKQDGNYVTSRKIGDMVYIFTNRGINRPALDREDAIKEKNLDQWIPQVNDVPISSGCIFLGEADSFQLGTLVSTFDVNEPRKTVDAKFVQNGSYSVYVSNDAIYFYRTDWGSREITNISKMSFEDGVMTAGESTSISGSIRDEFAISQQKGHLFVLSTEYNHGSEVNTLHVFDKNMKQVSVINEIARGELIYAARYVGNYAYFITYKQVDPLFIADISLITNAMSSCSLT